MSEPVAASLPLWPEVPRESSHPDSTACCAVCPVQILLSTLEDVEGLQSCLPILLILLGRLRAKSRAVGSA